MRARAALAIALFGLVIAPIVAGMLGTAWVGVTTSAVFAAIGIALFPEGAHAERR